MDRPNDLTILFDDDCFVILNKPAGLPVHPGRAGGPSVEDWFPLLSRRRAGPWLAHRLDTDTAGCLVVALRRQAMLDAQALFAAGRVRKTYWAVVRGGPAQDAGTMDVPLRKQTGRSGWRMVTDPAGLSAITDWRVLARGEGETLLELHPHTGRTHQIRVHCAALGCPIVGDPIYGGGPGRLHLLARAIALPLDPPISATAKPPLHMARAIARLTGPDRKNS